MAYPYTPPDYFLLDDLLTDEHKIVRSAIRDWVTRSVIPVIDEAAQKHHFPRHFFKELGDIGAFGPFYPCRIWWRRYGLYCIWRHYDRA